MSLNFTRKKKPLKIKTKLYFALKSFILLELLVFTRRKNLEKRTRKFVMISRHLNIELISLNRKLKFAYLT